MKAKLPVTRLFAIAVFCASTPALAQPVVSEANPYPLSSSNDPADRLSANLMLLAQNPRDLNALIGAGQSAVAVGDGNAALSFLARAEELAPRNGRIKAALGSALVLLERPGEALKLFSEASALGIPDVDLAKDRGLAYDLTGDSRRAQRDYLIAQRFGNDDEVTRRLALSFGISGDRSNALSLLDPLLRKQDQGAWRARAFILAMTGDLEGAEGIARSVMPIGTSDTMTPFLRRLARLNPAQRALAVNFGTMPSDGTRLAVADPADPFRSTASSGGNALIPAGDPLGAASSSANNGLVTRTPVPVSRDPRRRPGQIDPAAQVSLTPPAPVPDKLPDTRVVAALPAVGSSRIERRIEKRLGPVDEERLPPEVRSAMVRPAPAASSLTKLSPGRATEQRQPAPSPMAAAENRAINEKPAAIAAQPVVEKQDPLFEIPDAPQPVPVRIASIDPSPAGNAESITGTKPVDPSPQAANLSPAPQLAAAETAKQQPNPAALNGFSLAPGGMGEGAEALAAPAPGPGFSSATVDAVPAPGSGAIEQQSTVQIVQAAPSPAPVPAEAKLASSASTAKPDAGLAGIIASIEPEPESSAGPLPSAAEIRATRLAAQRKAAAEAKAKADADAKALAAKEAKEQERLAAARNPARLWVQVATGANESGLPLTWKRLREKSPATFKGLAAASVPFKATNRLLVGPFKSPSEARALVNAMQKAGMSATTFNSEAGQEVAKIASR